MIRSVELNNFKCFGHLGCELASVSVLAGLNGSGKSSLIQALLCAKAVAERYSRDAVAKLHLGDPQLNLGQAKDIAYRFAETNRVACKIAFANDKELAWGFDYQAKDGELNEIAVDVGDALSSGTFVLPQIRFLSANREGPRTLRPYDEARAREIDIGLHGEFVASCLEYNRDLEVLQELRIKDKLTSESQYGTLLEQTSAWLRKFSPNVFAVPKKSEDGRNVELKFGFGDRKSESLYRAENVGIGLSIALPLIVQLLSARPGDIILLENPESDLHPKGQSQLAELMARAAKAGVQVIVETHSDHIVNGLRVAVKNGRCRPEDVNLFFFNRHVDEKQSGWQVTTAEMVRFERSGALSNYPEDLLKQMMIDADALMSLDEEESGDESESDSES